MKIEDVIKVMQEQPNMPSSFRFPSVDSLIKYSITTDPQVATLARLIWKKVWVMDAIHTLSYSSETLAVLEFLPKTKAWVKSCHHQPSPMVVRREALNELLGFCGVEEIRKCRYEGRGENRHLVNSHMVAAYYLNAGDPYVPTLIFPTNSDTPYVGCWGDHPEVNK